MELYNGGMDNKGAGKASEVGAGEQRRGEQERKATLKTFENPHMKTFTVQTS